MLAREAESRLRMMLAEAGLDLNHLDPSGSWTVFQAFAAEPVDDIESGDDLLLFQCGAYDWHDGNGLRFNWGFTRQFGFNDMNGEYDHMEQLACTVFFSATDVPPETFTVGIWSGDGLAAWVAAVESDPGFRAALTLSPQSSSVAQYEV